MSKGGVYAITNNRNGHRYIGSAENLKRRFLHHRRNLRNNKHCNSHLQNAYNKYGESSFVYKPFFYCGKQDLIELEQMAIDLLAPEYNICLVAGSQLGYRHTAETRKKMSLSKTGNTYARGCKGYKHTPEARANMSAATRGKAWSQKRKERSRGVPWSPARRAAQDARRGLT